jgi:predicted MFS family arabinose efflux permease
LHDAGRSIPATGVAWLVILLAFFAAVVAGGSVTLLVVAIVLLDVAFQTTAILNQTRILATSHAARSRLNTTFVVASFTGAALGSALATTLWPLRGWPAITTAGIALSCVALTIWATIRPRAYRPV